MEELRVNGTKSLQLTLNGSERERESKCGKILTISTLGECHTEIS